MITQIEKRKLQRKKYRAAHREERNAYNNKWRAEHRESYRQKERERYSLLKKQAIFNDAARQKLIDISKKNKAYLIEYKAKNLAKVRQQQKAYRDAHKKERGEYDKTHRKKYNLRRREYRLCTVFNGEKINLRNLSKRPYPEPANCELCGKNGLRLVYHHYDDTSELIDKTASSDTPVFLLGFWVCQPCNILIHRLTEFPFLADKWFSMLEKQRKGAGY